MARELGTSIVCGCFVCGVDYTTAEAAAAHKLTVEHIARFAAWRYEARGRMGFHDFEDDEAAS